MDRRFEIRVFDKVENRYLYDVAITKNNGSITIDKGMSLNIFRGQRLLKVVYSDDIIIEQCLGLKDKAHL